jgi:Zn-dependent peptidase ImmA (M78 family)
MKALIVRAFQLGKISENQYSYLFRQLSMKGYKKAEPAPVPPEDPEMFRELLTFHRGQLGLGVKELSEMLGEPRNTSAPTTGTTRGASGS